MKDKKSSVRIFWIFEGLMGASILLLAVGFGCVWGDGTTALFAAQIPLHLALLAGAIRLTAAGLRRRSRQKKPARAAMAAGGLAVLLLLTVFGGFLPFRTDADTAALLARTAQACSERCAETGFSGAGMIYNDGVAEMRRAAVYRLPREETAAKRAYRRLAGNLWNGSAAPVNLLPFVYRRLPLENGYALLSPVIGTRIGTVPFGGEYLGYVFLHAEGENYCAAYVMRSEFPLGQLFCSGPETRDLSALTRKILAEPGSFLTAPADDPALH